MNYRRLALLALTTVVVSPVTAEMGNRPQATRNLNLHSASIGRKSIPKESSIDSICEEEISRTRPSSSQILHRLPRGGKGGSMVSQTASIWMGIILAMNSGFINGCALSSSITADASSQAVAAVTASWTNSALLLAAGNAARSLFFAKVIASFMLGSIIAGYMEPTPTQFLVSPKNYGGPLTVAAGLVALATVFLQDLGKVKLGFFLLAAANGINNSVTSTLTTNLCRTSHFTGISSDMGTFIGQILRGNKANLFKLKVFAGLAAAFWFGGYVSYGLSKTHGASALYASVAVYLFMALGYDKVAASIF